ncbi:MAG TPA: signal peptidase I [Leptolyngbyaceae cyanobacterium]
MSKSLHSPSKEPWLSVNLSLIFPGLGQLYSGKFLKGLFFIIAHVCLILAGIWVLISYEVNVIIGLIYLLIGLILIPVYCLFDAHRCAKKANKASFEKLRKSDKDAWLAVFLSRLLPGVGHIYIGKWPIGVGLASLAIMGGIITFISTSNLFYLVIASVLSILIWLSWPLIAYNAYLASPVRREVSPRLIKIFLVAAFIIPVLFSGLLGSSIAIFMAETRYIVSDSMLPTLEISDRLIVNKINYRFQAPKRGDIVIFYPAEMVNKQTFKDAFVSRIIGLPEEKIEVKEGKVYINDRPLLENYINEPPIYELGAIIIPPNCYALADDNRLRREESYYWEFVPRGNIIGKATKIFWPPYRIGVVK